MAKNGLLDQDFEEFEDDTQPQFGEDQPVVSPKKKEDDSDISVEVVDDTPEEDRGKWVADKDGDDPEPEDDAAKYSRRVKDRIAKETAKVHAERRAKEERERQLAEAVTFAKHILEENNQLKGLIENGEKVLVTESSSRLEGQIAAAKSAYREATEAGDVNGQLAAQENLAKAVAERDRLSTHRPQPLQRIDPQQVLAATADEPAQ